MRTAVADPLVGRVLEGRYRLAERLARGGMSTVYLAQDLRLDRAVAVKVMTADLSADAAFSDRFAREARAAARLTHLNVVAVYDQGVDGGHVFLVMELVRGSTVRDLLVERGALPLPLAVAVVEPVLAALAAAHRAGLVHRDVKPENVLLSDDGLVKVADFGLARAAEADVSSTRTTLMMGTVAYCSPEHVTNGRADARSDVYSAGIVLFELLTGRVPYTGESPVQVAYQHVHSRVPAPSSRVRGVPEQIDDLVVRATDPDPAMRPADAGAFLAELHELRALLRIPVTPLPIGSGRQRSGGPALDPGRPAPGPGGPATGPTAAGSRTTAFDRGPVERGPVDRGDPLSRTDAFAAVRGVDRRAPDGSTAAGARATTVVPSAPRRTTAVPAPPPAGDGWTGGWGPGTVPTTRATGGATAVAPPGGSRPPGRPGDDWPARRRRRRRRALVLALVVVLLGAAIGYGSWWYAAGRWAAVPDVLGRPGTDATSALRAAGFAIDGSPAQTYSETVPVGHVVSTDPGPGRRRVHGARVGLTVSRGAERFQVPTTAGLAQADAARVLSTIPVQVHTATASSDTVPTGTALGTDPPAGREVKRDVPVTLTVSSGPPVLPVPDVRGRSGDAARAALKAAGFTTATADDQFSDTVPAGEVVSQTPSAGTTAVKFSTVTVAVSKGPDLVAVPDIGRGPSLASATSVLQSAGFVVAIQKQYGGLLGLVVSMDPPSGTQLRRGSTVTLTVV